METVAKGSSGCSTTLTVNGGSGDSVVGPGMEVSEAYDALERINPEDEEIGS